jgi:hypothetical protein
MLEVGALDVAVFSAVQWFENGIKRIFMHITVVKYLFVVAIIHYVLLYMFAAYGLAQIPQDKMRPYWWIWEIAKINVWIAPFVTLAMVVLFIIYLLWYTGKVSCSCTRRS